MAFLTHPEFHLPLNIFISLIFVDRVIYVSRGGLLVVKY